MKSSRSLLNLTILYTIGNLSSKIISFVLVFFTTFYLSKEDVGSYDLILTTASLIVPLATMQLTDAAMRWLIDDNTTENKKKIFSNIMFIIAVLHILLYILLHIYNYFFPIKYLNLLFVIILSQSIYLFFLQCIRGLGKSKIYVISGLLSTFLYVALAIIALAILNFKIKGLLYSNIISNVGLCIILFFMVRFYNLWDYKIVKLDFCKVLLSYSFPLVPNALSWWAISSANRYIILIYLGASANGIFAIAYKLPTILLMFVNIFYLAWQEKAILSFKSEGRNKYYTLVLKRYVKILFSIAIFVVATNKIILSYIVNKEFLEAWEFTPLLLLGIVFSSLASFYGTGYISAKNTMGAFTSSFLGCITNIILSFILIPIWGLHGASISIAAGYFVLLLVRVYQTRNIFQINFPFKQSLLLLVLFGLVSIINYGNKLCLIINVIFSLIIVVSYNFTVLKGMFFKMHNIINRN